MIVFLFLRENISCRTRGGSSNFCQGVGVGVLTTFLVINVFYGGSYEPPSKSGSNCFSRGPYNILRKPIATWVRTWTACSPLLIRPMGSQWDTPNDTPNAHMILRNSGYLLSSLRAAYIFRVMLNSHELVVNSPGLLA